MRNTLQDQLLKSGLANKKQAVRAKKAKNNKEKLRRTGKEVIDEAAESVKAAELAKVEKDKQLNREKHLAAEKKAIQAQIRQLIEMNGLKGSLNEGSQNDSKEEFRFDDNGVIKTVQVSQVQRKQLAAGTLAVVSFSDGFEIVNRAVAQKIMERDASFILCLHEKADDTEIEDEYSDYQVPDDLMW